MIINIAVIKIHTWKPREDNMKRLEKYSLLTSMYTLIGIYANDNAAT